MVNTKLSERISNDLDNIVAEDRKARNILDQIKQVSMQGKRIHHTARFVIIMTVFVGIYCLGNILFRFNEFTNWWLMAIYVYISFITSLPHIFRTQFHIPDQYDLLHLNLVLLKNPIILNEADSEKRLVRYQIECKWYGEIHIHVRVSEKKEEG